MRRPVPLVLNHREKFLRRLRPRIVVHTGGIDVEHLSPENAFRRTDVADAAQQFLEVIAAAGLPEAFVVHGEAFDQVLLQLGSRPLAELRAARRAYAIPDGEYELQVVVLQTAAHLAGAFLANL